MQTRNSINILPLFTQRLLQNVGDFIAVSIRGGDKKNVGGAEKSDRKGEKER